MCLIPVVHPLHSGDSTRLWDMEREFNQETTSLDTLAWGVYLGNGLVGGACIEMWHDDETDSRVPVLSAGVLRPDWRGIWGLERRLIFARIRWCRKNGHETVVCRLRHHGTPEHDVIEELRGEQTEAWEDGESTWWKIHLGEREE